MNRNYYCKVNSQKEADELLKKLKDIGEDIDRYNYTKSWQYIVYDINTSWALSDIKNWKEEFKNKIEVPASELIDYVTGKKLDKDALLEEAIRRFPLGTKYRVKEYTTGKHYLEGVVSKTPYWGNNGQEDIISGYNGILWSAKYGWSEIIEKPKVETKFEKGKWYELKYNFKDKLCNIIGKSIESSTNILYFNKYYNIIKGKWSEADFLSLDKDISLIYSKELSLQEIQQYLPVGHPDKQPKTLTVNDLVEGEVYYTEYKNGDSPHIFKYLGGPLNGCRNYCIVNGQFTNLERTFVETNYRNNIRIATPQEKKWLTVCIKQNKFIEQSELDKYDDEGNLIQNFKFGKWYKANDKIFGEYIYFIKSKKEYYGFNNISWVNKTDGILNLEGWTPATDKEVSDKLLSYAMSKYPVGTKFKSCYQQNLATVIDLNYKWVDYHKAVENSNGGWVYQLGEWAEIVESPKEQVVDNEEFKVGDWVVVTERHDENSANVGDVVRLVTIDNSSIPYEVSDDGRYNYAFSPSWCKKVRKALPHEIPNSNHSDLETDSGQFKWVEHCKLLFDKQVEEDRDYFNKAQAKFIDEMFKLNPLIPEECTKIKIPKLIDRSKLDIKIKETKVKQIKL